MDNKSFAAAKVNFRNMKLPLIITGIVMLAIFAQDLVYIVLSFFNVRPGEGNTQAAFGNYLYLLILLSAVLFPLLNFRKMMNLGAKRRDFFTGCAVNYIILAGAVSFMCIVFYYTYERLMQNYYSGGTLNVLYWFGWIENGPVVAFFQQFAFLLLLASAVHTLSAAQDRWFGWLTDAVIVGIISTFTPIASLRPVLVWFFNMIIFHDYAWVQIAFCLLLAAAIYALNKPMLARKVL